MIQPITKSSPCTTFSDVSSLELRAPDLMAEQVKAIKDGKSISKPIYNHVTGNLDDPEEIQPTPIFVRPLLCPQLFALNSLHAFSCSHCTQRAIQPTLPS